MNINGRLVRFAIVLGVAVTVALLVTSPADAVKPDNGGRPGGEAAGNNLSFPVIWAEGVTKVLRGTYGEVNLDGTMWYWWGTDADGNPESCLADVDDTSFCDDAASGTVGPAPCEDRGDPDCMVVFAQQDSNNDWQAGSADWSAAPVNIHWIDWGDNLESVDWYTRSKVRTEVVLFQDLVEPMAEYGMRHLYGLGINEMWGLATDGVTWDPIPDDEIDETVYYTAAELLDGYQATVYSDCARLTIQKLTKARDDVTLTTTWNAIDGYWEGDVNGPIFNSPVWEGGDGPGYYSAEINVKGRIIYGYTWDVKKLNDGGAGDYRITFSFDSLNCPATLNAFFDANTQILVPVEEETVAAKASEEEPGGGAVGVIDPVNNLSYIDVRILAKTGGGGGH